MINNTELAGKPDELEPRVAAHDETIAGSTSAIRELASPAAPKPKRRTSFVVDP